MYGVPFVGVASLTYRRAWPACPFGRIATIFSVVNVLFVVCIFALILVTSQPALPARAKAVPDRLPTKSR
jgi:hypothetical protein